MHYLPGPPVAGFYGFFEADFGDPDSPTPYPRVTPTRICDAVLPFRCPRCKGKIDFTSPERREHYHDTRPQHDNHHCPACGMRFFLNPGQPWSGGKLDEKGCAPSTVEYVSRKPSGLLEVRREELGVRKALSSVADLYLLGCDAVGVVDG